MIRRLLHRVLRLFGLVSARRHELLARDLESVSKKYSQARQESKAWEKRAQRATQHADTFQERLKSVNKDVRRLEKAKINADREVKALQGRLDDIDRLRRALPETERELSMARDHLMAIEVKLDILEGAANVLDLRTRGNVIPGLAK